MVRCFIIKALKMNLNKQSVFFLFIIFTIQLKAQDTDLRSKIQEHRNNPDSLEFYSKQMYKESIKSKDVSGMINALMALGSAEMRQGNFRESNDYYHKLIKLANKNDMSSLGYGAMSNLAINHRRLQRNDSAFFYFKKVNGFYSKNDFKMSANQAKMNLGISYFQYQELDSAYHYLRLSHKGFKALGNKRLIAQNQSLLAETYYQMENYNKAIELADSSLAISRQINFKRNFSRNYSLLSRSYERIGNNTKADDYAILEEQNMQKMIPNSNIGRLNEKYENEVSARRESRINQVKENNKFYKYNLFITILICVLLTGASVVLLKKNKSTKQEVLELQQLIEDFSISKSKEVLDKADNNIILKNNMVLNTKKILYIKSNGHYLNYFIVGKENPEIERNSLTKALDSLPKLLFTRIHRSYIVNIEHIKIINSNQLMLINGEWIPLSRTYKPIWKELLNKR